MDFTIEMKTEHGELKKNLLGLSCTMFLVPIFSIFRHPREPLDTIIARDLVDNLVMFAI